MQQQRKWSVLLVSFALHFITSLKANKIDYKLRINEKGTRFSEKITINEKENTVLFTVPKHNDIESSVFLYDFNRNITISRLPDEGRCQIQPLDKNLPHPRQLKSNMDLVKNTNALRGRKSMMVTSTRWTLGKQLKENDLDPSVVKFCAGFPIYRLKEVNDDNWEVEQDSANRRVRRKVAKYRFCRSLTQYGNAIWKCDSTDWKMNCKITTQNFCVYWVNCDPPITVNNFKKCTAIHNFNSVVCCNPFCP